MSQPPDLISVAAIITAITGAVGGLTAALSSRKTRKQVQPEDGRSIAVVLQNVESLLINHITDGTAHGRLDSPAVVEIRQTIHQVAPLPSTSTKPVRPVATSG